MVKIVQHSFLGGQLDFEMMGRQDVEKYAKGATLLKNFLPLKRGAITKRPGTDFRHTVTGNVTSGYYRLIPFSYTRTEGWVLLFKNDGITAYSSTQEVAVTVAARAGFYTSAEIGEVDYCQSGDIVFLAHRNHPPQMIEHVVSDGSHSFTLKKVPVNGQSAGKPTITGATVSKLGVTDLGGTVTEYYKATAVYDGVETFASAPFYGNECGDSAADSWQSYKEKMVALAAASRAIPYDFQPPSRSYAGTSYHMPWSQSQTIKLTISVPAQNGPEQIRIYRKSGGIYGLVGFVETGLGNSDTAADALGGEVDDPSGVSVIAATDDGPENSTLLLDGDGDGVHAKYFGLGGDGFTLSKKLTIELGAKCKVKVTLFPGHVSRAWSNDHSALIYTFASGAANRVSITTQGTSTYSFNNGVDVTFNNISRNRDAYIQYLGDNDLEDTDEIFVAYAENVMKGRLYGKNAVVGDVSHTIVHTSTSSLVTKVVIKPMQGTTLKPMVLNGILIEAVAAGSATPATGMASFNWVDRYYTPDASRTPPKEETFMDRAGEYPACVCLSQQRLIWASTKNEPGRILMSQIGDLYTYAHHEELVADDPIDFQVSATRFPKVNHLVEMRKLLMFCGDSEWVVDSASANSGITFETVQARQHSSIGAAEHLKPLVCDNVLLFAERTGQAVRQYGYQLEDDGFGGTDVSILAASIFKGRRIVSWAFQQHPNATCWCVMDDGTLCSLTFMREQNTVAWATHELGGGGLARAVACTHALVGSGGQEDTSQTFLLVQRGDVYTLEEMRPFPKHGSDKAKNYVCMDSVRGTNASGLTGAGGKYGYAFGSVFESVYPVVAEAVGLAQMDVRCVQEAHLRLADSVGGTVRAAGVPASQASALVKTPAPSGTGDAAVELATVDENVPLVGNNDRDGRVVVEQGEPWPFTLLMLETDVVCEESGRR